MHRLTRRARFLSIAAFLPVTTLHADSLTWTNFAGDGLWSNPLNWSTSTLPTEADSVTFPSVIPASGAIVTLPDNALAHSISFANNYTLTGGSLDLFQPAGAFGSIGSSGTAQATVASTLTGSGGLSLGTYPGNTLTLSGDNTFTTNSKSIQPSGQGVTITRDSSLGDPANPVLFYATLVVDSTFSSGRPFQAGTSQAGINVTANNTFTISNLIGSGSQLDKYGPGTLALSAPLKSTFGDPFPTRTHIYQGALRIEDPLAIGASNSEFDQVYVTSTGIFEIACGQYNARRIDIDGTGATLRGGNGAATFSGIINAHARDFTLAGGPTDADSLTFAPPSFTSVSSSNTLTVTGPGRVILTNSAPFPNKFSLTPTGTLQLNHAGALGPSPVAIPTGTLALSGITFTPAITLSGGSISPGDAPARTTGNLTLPAIPNTLPLFKLSAPGLPSQNLTISGQISQNNRFAVINPAGGPASLILTNPNNTLVGPNAPIYVFPNAGLTSAPANATSSTLGNALISLLGGSLNLLGNTTTIHNIFGLGVGLNPSANLAPLTVPSSSSSTLFVDRATAGFPGGGLHIISSLALPYPAHTLTLSSDHNTRLQINTFANASTVTLSPGLWLTLNALGGNTGVIDLQPASRLMVNGSNGNPVADFVRQQIRLGNLTSSAPDPTDSLSLGYLVNGSLTTVLLTPTGDANLNGVIDPDDYALLDASFAKSLASALWQNGDFNYDSIIDNEDYLLIDRTFALSQAHGFSPGFLAHRESQFGPDYVSQLLTTIPEPSLPLSAIPYPLSRLLFPRRRRRAR